MFWRNFPALVGFTPTAQIRRNQGQIRPDIPAVPGEWRIRVMKSKRVVVATTLVVLLALSVIACSRAKSDAQIIGEVVTKIQSDSQVANKQISVMSSNGLVTLSGSAASEAERAAVANDAAQVEGVKTVVNNLMVAGIPAPIQQAEVQEPQPTPATPVQAAASARARKPAAYRERQVVTPAAS